MITAEPGQERWWRTSKGKNLLYGTAAVFLGLVIWFVGLPCPFYEMTGFYCPGCGATRAVKALARGDFLTAFHDNAWLFLFAGPALALSAATSIWKIGDRQREWLRRYLLVTAYAAGIFFVLRNLHFAPFNLLAPID